MRVCVRTRTVSVNVCCWPAITACLLFYVVVACFVLYRLAVFSLSPLFVFATKRAQITCITCYMKLKSRMTAPGITTSMNKQNMMRFVSE